MGVFYVFYNKTRDEHNQQVIPGFGPCTHIAKLNWLSHDEVIRIFQSVIMVNNWDVSDKIRASPDYHECSFMDYENGNFEYVLPDGPDDLYDKFPSSSDEETLFQTNYSENEIGVNLFSNQTNFYPDDGGTMISY